MTPLAPFLTLLLAMLKEFFTSKKVLTAIVTGVATMLIKDPATRDRVVALGLTVIGAFAVQDAGKAKAQIVAASAAAGTSTVDVSVKSSTPPATPASEAITPVRKTLAILLLLGLAASSSFACSRAKAAEPSESVPAASALIGPVYCHAPAPACPVIWKAGDLAPACCALGAGHRFTGSGEIDACAANHNHPPTYCLSLCGPSC